MKVEKILKDDTYYFVYFDDGTVYLHKYKQTSGSENIDRGDSKIIRALCEALVNSGMFKKET